MDTLIPQKKVLSFTSGLLIFKIEPKFCPMVSLQVMCILTSSPLVIAMASLWELWILKENLVSVRVCTFFRTVAIPAGGQPHSVIILPVFCGVVCFFL